MAETRMELVSPIARQWLIKEGVFVHEDVVLRARIEAILPKLKSFEFRDSDVLISTYPRSGTTWTQEMIWLICNKADTEGAKAKALGERFPFIESTFNKENLPNVDILQNTPSPRFIKTHLLPQFYDKFATANCKTIAVMRNVKDMAVSLFHFHRNLHGFEGTWDDFFGTIKHDVMLYGSWLKHSLQLWELRDDPRVLVLKYEDTQRDHTGTIQKMADFLGKTLTEEQVDAIADHTKLRNMKKHVEETSREGKKDFIRKGIVGEWSKWFTEEQLEFVEGLLKEAEQHGLFFTDTAE